MRPRYLKAQTADEYNRPEGVVGYCRTHDSPGLWFADGSGGCMWVLIVESHSYDDCADWEPLYRKTNP